VSDVGAEGRSFEKITQDDLRRLASIAHEDRESFFADHQDWASLYQNRLLAVALCQGAAAHFVEGQRGINDFDVYTFYAAHPSRPWYAKRNKPWDYGDPKFGRTVDRPEYIGRRVDLLGRGIHYRHEEDPAAAIRRWLRTDGGKSAQLIAQRPVVLLWPEERLGEVIWEPGSVTPAV
jgi:hypothetical protein